MKPAPGQIVHGIFFFWKPLPSHKSLSFFFLLHRQLLSVFDHKTKQKNREHQTWLHNLRFFHTTLKFCMAEKACTHRVYRCAAAGSLIDAAALRLPPLAAAAELKKKSAKKKHSTRCFLLV